MSKIKYRYTSIITLFFISGCMFSKPDYLTMISADELNNLMQAEDIYLVDVHIPRQQHIKGTDIFIPYNEIEKFQNKLPEDKNTVIYLYCEGGPMANAAARTFHELGYKNLYNLTGGAQAWKARGYALE